MLPNNCLFVKRGSGINSGKTDAVTTVEELKNVVRQFCEARDWDRYHNPKDLAIGIATEASELLELFRWKSLEECEKILSDHEKRTRVQEELADIFYFVLRFAQKSGIDVTAALLDKIRKNEERYPVDKSKGSNKKYTELE